MNINELIDASVTKSGTTKKDAGAAIRAALEAITEAMAKGEDVRIVGFGTFSPRNQPAKVGRNPRTGEPLEIAASVQAKFKPGKGLTEALNVA